MVHLKRFQYDGWLREKIETLVDFPLQGLDLSRYVLDQSEVAEHPPIYDLYAVSNHSGGLSGGHYTAYGLNDPLGRWYHFDDRYAAGRGMREAVTRRFTRPPPAATFRLGTG